MPPTSRYSGSVAIDTETLGLNPLRDRLCLVQLSGGDGNADIVQIAPGQREAPRLTALLADPCTSPRSSTSPASTSRCSTTPSASWPAPLFCTKIASRLTRTYTDRHGLKDLVKDLLDIEISKQQQSSDWAAETLSEAQLAYAASDVLHLHALKEKLEQRLDREGRRELAEACFRFLPTRARLDLAGWGEEDIFAH